MFSRRSRGVGSTLIKMIENTAIELGIAHLYLYTPESEIYYTELGWHVMKRENYHNVPVTIMEKQLWLHIHQGEFVLTISD